MNIGHKVLSFAIFLLQLLSPLVYTQAQTWYRQSGGVVLDSYKHYTSVVVDSPGVIVTNSGTFRLSHSTIITSGNSSNIDSSNLSGQNAGVLLKAGSTGDFRSDTIYTTGKGANGLYVTGAGSSVTIANSKIFTSGRHAHGVNIVRGATATITNVDVSATSDTASAIMSGNGGMIHLSGGTLTAAGNASAGIYSAGEIHVSNATVASISDHGAVADIDGKIYISNSSLAGAQCGLKVYNTVGSAAVSTVDMSGGSMTANRHAFYDTAAKVNITVKDHAVISAGSGYLLYALSGGTMNFTAQRELLTGNIYADNASVISVVLQDTTTLTGKVQNASVSLDATSEWIVADTSHINVLTNAAGVNLTTLAVSNIRGNGRNVYYNASLAGNSWLAGNYYTLAGGGCLLPEGTVCGGVNIATPERGSHDVSVYPNPASDQLTIAFPAAHSGVSISIMTMDGRLLKNLIVAAGSRAVCFPVHDLASGPYILVVAGDEGRSIIRFVRQ